ncbi:MAG: hypothetical protein IKC03_02700 [Oscillospiraceae bacterium]|nr:hypothetical protein [Oscillospiraceae bacterium]
MTISKNMSKILSLVLALTMCLSLGISASAAEIDTSGGSGSTPVSLTTSNDGLGEDTDGDGIPDGPGTVTPTKMSVVVPTALPMAMSDDGTVVTATYCKIINYSYGSVRVKTVTISAASDWNLTAFGPKSSLASEKVDSNKLGFALSIGGGQQVQTATNDATQQLISAPIDGCYMTGVGDLNNNSVSVEYAAIVTPLSNTVTNTTVANVVFVIEWNT